jgi:hypothetical protein
MAKDTGTGVWVFFSFLADVLKRISSVLCHVLNVIHVLEARDVRCGLFLGLIKVLSRIACAFDVICGTCVTAPIA